MASANVIELTTANWEQEVVKSDKPVLVDFWAVWCGPCRMLAPTIDKIADQFAGKVKVGKLNTDESQEIAIKYGISAIPQILLFKGGSDQPIDKQIGNQPIDNIVKMLNRALEA
jgi:thioredoxin 1